MKNYFPKLLDKKGGKNVVMNDKNLLTRTLPFINKFTVLCTCLSVLFAEYFKMTWNFK